MNVSNNTKQINCRKNVINFIPFDLVHFIPFYAIPFYLAVLF